MSALNWIGVVLALVSMVLSALSAVADEFRSSTALLAGGAALCVVAVWLMWS